MSIQAVSLPDWLRLYVCRCTRGCQRAPTRDRPATAEVLQLVFPSVRSVMVRECSEACLKFMVYYNSVQSVLAGAIEPQGLDWPIIG